MSIQINFAPYLSAKSVLKILKVAHDDFQKQIKLSRFGLIRHQPSAVTFADADHYSSITGESIRNHAPSSVPSINLNICQEIFDNMSYSFAKKKKKILTKAFLHFTILFH